MFRFENATNVLYLHRTSEKFNNAKITDHHYRDVIHFHNVATNELATKRSVHATNNVIRHEWKTRKNLCSDSERKTKKAMHCPFQWCKRLLHNHSKKVTKQERWKPISQLIHLDYFTRLVYLFVGVWWRGDFARRRVRWWRNFQVARWPDNRCLSHHGGHAEKLIFPPYGRIVRSWAHSVCFSLCPKKALE